MQSALRTRSICIIAELIVLSANVEADDLRTLLKLWLQKTCSPRKCYRKAQNAVVLSLEVADAEW